MNPCLETLAKENINLIAPLWEKLNLIHLNDSRHWKERYRTMTFEKRSRSLLRTGEGDLLILAISDGGAYRGYCISSVNREKSSGEIESLFIDEELRGLRWGERLVEKSLAWMRKQGAERISVSVCEGHESVFPFYEKMGFLPRLTTLELK